MTLSTGNDGDVRIALALARLEDTLEHRPGFGRATSRSTTTVVDGLRCSTVEGDRVVLTDLPPALGGEGAAPSPSHLVRAAVGSCLAMGYRLRAARERIEVGAIRVVVESDSELASLVHGGSPAGFVSLRVQVEIESDEAPEVIGRLVDEADRRSPVLDVVVRSNEVHRSVAVVPRSR